MPFFWSLLFFGFSIQVCQSVMQRSKIKAPLEEWVQLTEKIITREMTDCSLLVAFHDAGRIAPILEFINTNVKGATMTKVGDDDVPSLSFLKEQLLRTNPTSCLNFLILFTEPMMTSLLQETAKFWGGHQKILIVALPGNYSLVGRRFLMQPNFRFSAQLVLIEQSKPNEWNIYSLFLFKGEDRQTTRLVNRWSPRIGFRKSTLAFSPSKNSDFEGYNFAVAALPYSPFVIKNDLTQNGPERYRGMEVAFLNAVSKGANFTYHFVAPEDGQWGKELADGSWTGMIGMVGREEANWAISDITFSLQRLSFIDFTDTIVYDASELITPRALPLPLWQGPTRPFSGEVWIATILFTLSMSVLVALVSKLSPVPTEKYSYFSSFGKSFLYCLQIILMRGGTGLTEKNSVRVVLCTWLLNAMIISVFYTSSLTSFLILPGYTKPIQNFEQLVKSDIGWAKVDFGGVQNNYLQAAEDPVLKALAEGVEWGKSLDDILKRVVEGEIATWENAITTKLKVAIEYTNGDGQRMVHFTSTALLLERVMWPVQKYAPYKKRLDEVIKRVVESGLLDKFYSDIIFEESLLSLEKKKANPDVQKKDESSQVILTLSHFQGPFFILILGYLFGFVILVLEYGTKKIMGRNKKT